MGMFPKLHLETFQTISKVSSPILFQLVMARPKSIILIFFYNSSLSQLI